ncbi:MAG: hypothetical protein ACRD2Z_09635 [Thermoanaerobaculia bacterium]
MTPRVVLEFEVLPDERYGDVPGDVRLRRLLKTALRRLGLRCVAMRQIAASRPDSDPRGHRPRPTATGRESPGTVVEESQ